MATYNGKEIRDIVETKSYKDGEAARAAMIGTSRAKTERGTNSDLNLALLEDMYSPQVLDKALDSMTDDALTELGKDSARA